MYVENASGSTSFDTLSNYWTCTRTGYETFMVLPEGGFDPTPKTHVLGSELAIFMLKLFQIGGKISDLYSWMHSYTSMHSYKSPIFSNWKSVLWTHFRCMQYCLGFVHRYMHHNAGKNFTLLLGWSLILMECSALALNAITPACDWSSPSSNFSANAFTKSFSFWYSLFKLPEESRMKPMSTLARHFGSFAETVK